MKFRSGFVSNSSSSSFVCEICKEIVSGMDMGLEDAEMVRCENDHTFCESHINSELEDEFQEYLESDEDNDGRYAIPKKFCPLCNFEEISDSDALKFLFKKQSIDLKKFLSDIKEEFKDYETFENYLKPDTKK